jgi:hypothetical protein
MNIDLTGVAVSLIGAFASIVGAVFLAWLQSHMKDQQAAATIGTAVQNAVGAMQQAAQSGIGALKPSVNIPGMPPNMQVGVQYVLDHAGDELKRYTDITPDKIADKIKAQIGLYNIDSNVNTAAAPGPTTPPMAPVSSGGAPAAPVAPT